MTRACLAFMLMSFTAAAAAQAPVQEVTARGEAVRRSQIATSEAHRELQQAQHEAKLAEQDFVNGQDAFRAAHKQADELKRQMDAARKALDTARAREAQARKRYDGALQDVDRAFQKPGAK